MILPLFGFCQPSDALPTLVARLSIKVALEATNFAFLARMSCARCASLQNQRSAPDVRMLDFCKRRFVFCTLLFSVEADYAASLTCKTSPPSLIELATLHSGSQVQVYLRTREVIERVKVLNEGLLCLSFCISNCIPWHFLRGTRRPACLWQRSWFI